MDMRRKGPSWDQGRGAGISARALYRPAPDTSGASDGSLQAYARPAGSSGPSADARIGAGRPEPAGAVMRLPRPAHPRVRRTSRPPRSRTPTGTPGAPARGRSPGDILRHFLCGGPECRGHPFRSHVSRQRQTRRSGSGTSSSRMPNRHPAPFAPALSDPTGGRLAVHRKPFAYIAGQPCAHPPAAPDGPDTERRAGPARQPAGHPYIKAITAGGRSRPVRVMW